MIYLDNHATTACDPQVIAAMAPFYSITYGNAASSHPFGELSAQAVNDAKKNVAELINGMDGELVFTSGATESNNIALLGLALGYQRKTGKRSKILTTGIEHKAILSPLTHLEKDGWTIEYLPLTDKGLVDLGEARKIIDNDTLLVSVQLANSEIGTIQPIKELAALAHQSGAFIHSDASQAIGKIVFDVAESGVDLLSFSAHKLYGPKGIGAIWIKDAANLRQILQPITYGGDSGSPYRPGTLPVQLIAGFGMACRLCREELLAGNQNLRNLRDRFERLLKAGIPSLTINGDLQNRLPNNSNLTFPGVEADMLLANLPEVIVSTGSACESGSIEPSRVLTAIGISREAAYHTLRVGFGRFNTLEEAETAARQIIRAYENVSDILGGY